MTGVVRLDDFRSAAPSLAAERTNPRRSASADAGIPDPAAGLGLLLAGAGVGAAAVLLAATAALRWWLR